MIGEFFLNIVFGIVSGFFDLMPEIVWDVNTTAFQYFMDILKFAGYMFPWGTVVAIVTIVFSISIFRIVISAIKSLWGLLPFA